MIIWFQKRVVYAARSGTFFRRYRRNMDKGLVIGAVFINLSKAFDTLDHARLLSKLSISGIKSRKLSWFSSYLFDRTQFLIYNGQSSEMQPITCGVPRGSILGPLMLALLLNGIDTKFATDCQLLLLYCNNTLLKCHHQIRNSILKRFRCNV